jgi:hypothetical protein
LHLSRLILGQRGSETSQSQIALNKEAASKQGMKSRWLPGEASEYQIIVRPQTRKLSAKTRHNSRPPFMGNRGLGRHHRPAWFLRGIPKRFGNDLSSSRRYEAEGASISSTCNRFVNNSSPHSSSHLYHSHNVNQHISKHVYIQISSELDP